MLPVRNLAIGHAIAACSSNDFDCVGRQPPPRQWPIIGREAASRSIISHHVQSGCSFRNNHSTTWKSQRNCCHRVLQDPNDYQHNIHIKHQPKLPNIGFLFYMLDLSKKERHDTSRIDTIRQSFCILYCTVHIIIYKYHHHMLNYIL